METKTTLDLKSATHMTKEYARKTLERLLALEDGNDWHIFTLQAGDAVVCYGTRDNTHWFKETV